MLYVTEVSCGVPPSPPFMGLQEFTGIQHGDTVIYTCQPGYHLHGAKTLKCDSTGEWGQPPTCTSKCYHVC